MGFWEFIGAYWWLAFIIGPVVLDILAEVFTSAGGAFRRIGEAKGKNKRLKAENKALQRENENLKGLLTTSIGAASGGAGGTQVAELAAQAKNALEDRTVLLTLLAQVRATDRAYPQLPEELATSVSTTLDRMLPSGIPVETSKAERRALGMPRKA